MNTDTIQQEVLLLTGTSFSQRQLCGNYREDEQKNLSNSEKLERACWEGLLNELLPEIITNKKLSIWQIWDTAFSLQIEFSRYPSGDEGLSINPYYFSGAINYN